MIEKYYDNQLTRERKTAAANSFGAYEETWGSPYIFYAAIRPLSGDMRYSADKKLYLLLIKYIALLMLKSMTELWMKMDII